MGDGSRVEVGGLVCRWGLCRIRTSFSFVLGGMEWDGFASFIALLFPIFPIFYIYLFLFY